MYRYGLMKEIIHFKTVCGANKFNPHVLLYDDYDRHFDYRAIHILCSHQTKPFVLKAGESVNNKTNDNGPNLKLKGIYGQARINWQR